MALTQIEQGMLKDGILTADTAGRLKMADGFVNSAKMGAGAAKANWGAGGILQVKQVLSSAWSYNGSTGTYTEMSTGLRASITPSSSTSKIIYSVSGGRLSYTSPSVNCRVEVRRSTDNGSTWVATHRWVQDLRYPSGTYGFIIAAQFIDEPATTNSCMYSLFASITEGTSGFECGSTAEEKTKIVLMEVAG